MIGRILDKYEILEEVGQGGMSVVYKGMDTSLHREVAVKVLHPHLASHVEARRRFEREAQAVAKLRHENILEIFDYSGKNSSESYIVTEFIRGRTLKDFITDHKIAFPEIGAMIVAEVCRALGHAHSLGVLHRDVKPENIMIRDDGVVKLMDFGIAQIVDAQRMTVTGQLLGSPAYMSPEHVEGKPLDFRTDVFSVGILMYQLATGELPFKGRNPHEILKRIAECRFIDARVVNPLVGERFGKIIAKALAHDPDDRFADVAPMLDEIARYLGEAELGEPRAELARFFAAPVPYEQALRQRLISALTKRGKQELADKKTNSALELYNRVLTIDPANEEVLREIDKLSRRKRALRGVALGMALTVVVGSVAAVRFMWPRHDQKVAVVGPSHDHGAVPDAAVAMDVTPDASNAIVARTDFDAGAVVENGPADGGATAIKPIHNVVQIKHSPDAGAMIAVPMVQRKFVLSAIPRTATYRIDDGAPQNMAVGMGRTEIPLPPGRHTILVEASCCKSQTITIDADEPEQPINAYLEFKPIVVTFSCLQAKSIVVNGKPVANNAQVTFDLESVAGTYQKTVEVVFQIGDTAPAKKTVILNSMDATRGSRQIACDLQ